MNTSEVTQTIRVEFWVASFGFGIPFTNTNIVPTYRVITLGPESSKTVGAVWTPQGALNTGGASGPATINVEGYVDGELIGGGEVQLKSAPPEWKIYLPLVRR